MENRLNHSGSKNKTVILFSFYCALVAFIFIPQINDSFNLPKFLVASGGSIFFLCYLCINSYNKKTLSFYQNPLYLPFLLFLGWQILSLFYAINKISGIIEIGLNIIGLTLLFIVPYVLKKSEDIVLFARILVISSLFIAVYGILEHLGIDFIKWNITKSALSTFGRRNFAAEYLVFILPWAFFAFLASKKYMKWLFLLIIIFLLVHLFLTFTRTAWIAFVLSFLTMIFLLFKAHINRWTFLKYISIIIFIVLAGNCWATVFQFEPGTVKSRFLIWKTCLSMIKSNPLFGCGVGNFEVGYYAFAAGNPDVFLSLTQRITHAHNEFLEIWVETGIIGLSLFLFFIFAIFRMAFDIMRIKEKSFEKSIAIVAFSSIIGLGINCFASFPLQTISSSFFFFISCGILSGVYFNVREKKPIQIGFHHPAVPFCCMIIICLYIVFAFTSINSSYSLMKAKKIMHATIKSKNPVLWLVAEAYGKNAVNYNPFNIENYFLLGEIYLVGNQTEKARENFLKALKFQPYSDLILNNLGITEQRSKNFQRAETYFLKALSINQKNPETLRNFGNLYLEKKDYTRAISYFSRCLKLNKNDTRALFGIAQTYIEMGDDQKAKEVLEKWKEIDQENN